MSFFVFVFSFVFYTLTHQRGSLECYLPPISDLHPGEIENAADEIKGEILPSAEQQKALWRLHLLASY